VAAQCELFLLPARERENALQQQGAGPEGEVSSLPLYLLCVCARASQTKVPPPLLHRLRVESRCRRGEERVVTASRNWLRVGRSRRATGQHSSWVWQGSLAALRRVVVARSEASRSLPPSPRLVVTSLPLSTPSRAMCESGLVAPCPRAQADAPHHAADEALTAALDLIRRLPPQTVDQHLDHLCQLQPDLADDLLSSVDQPLQLRHDSSSRDYLVRPPPPPPSPHLGPASSSPSHTLQLTRNRTQACDYNRDGDSYRSPWTNEYDPPLADGTLPSGPLRHLELALNDAFDVYRDLYYEGGVSSVYLWDTDEGFAGVVLVKKGASPFARRRTLCLRPRSLVRALRVQPTCLRRRPGWLTRTCVPAASDAGDSTSSWDSGPSCLPS